MYVDIRDLFGRQSTDCGQGTAFYRCGNNNFSGCCSVDPCALPACPDGESSNEPDNPPPGLGGDDDDDEESDGGGGNEDTTSSSSPSKTTDKEAETTSLGTPTTSLTLVTRTAANGDVETTTIATVITITPDAPAETGDGSSGSAPDDTSGTDFELPPKNNGSISKGAIAGIAVGVALAIIIFVIAFILFLRRRKKRTSNVTVIASSSGGVGDLGGDVAAAKLPDASSTPGSLAMAQGQGNDPFAPFGGKYDPRASHNGPSRVSQVSSMGETMPVSPTTAVSGKATSIDETQIQGPAQLDSTPVKPTLEMDASDAAVAKKPAIVEMDATATARTASDTSSSSSASLSSVPSSLRPGGDPKRLSPNVPPTVAEIPSSETRATLDPTEDEKKGRRAYVTSWSQYEGAPATSR